MADTKVKTDLELAAKHRYRDPRSGQLMTTSATRVAKAFSDGDIIGAAAGAAVKLTKAGIDYRREWNDRMWRGVRLHEHIGHWAEGKTAEVDERDDAYLDAFLAFCEGTKPVWLQSERVLVSARGCGGRMDLVGELEHPPGQRDFWLIDAKSGKLHYYELMLQLAGYASMDGMVTFDSEGNAEGLEPMPFFTRWGGLYLDGHGKAHLVEVPVCAPGQSREQAQAGAIDAFNYLLKVRSWADTVPEVEGW
jgi:hypothetical protein